MCVEEAVEEDAGAEFGNWGVDGDGAAERLDLVADIDTIGSGQEQRTSHLEERVQCAAVLDRGPLAGGDMHEGLARTGDCAGRSAGEDEGSVEFKFGGHIRERKVRPGEVFDSVHG